MSKIIGSVISYIILEVIFFTAMAITHIGLLFEIGLFFIMFVIMYRNKDNAIVATYAIFAFKFSNNILWISLIKPNILHDPEVWCNIFLNNVLQAIAFVIFYKLFNEFLFHKTSAEL